MFLLILKYFPSIPIFIFLYTLNVTISSLDGNIAYYFPFSILISIYLVRKKITVALELRFIIQFLKFLWVILCHDRISQ